MHFCGYIAHYPPPCENDAHLPTCPPPSLLSPHQEEQGRRTEAPLPAASLVSRSIETGCLWEGGSFGGAFPGAWTYAGRPRPSSLLFLDPCSLWVCGCVCMRVCACVCFNFLYGKMDKKIEREVFNCNKLASVAPPCLSVFWSMLGMGTGRGPRAILRSKLKLYCGCVKMAGELRTEFLH